eukprot:2350343-Ditylum_brightwellii.AAC.1
MAFYDLTDSPAPFTPSHIKNLLGLDLKFCPTPRHTTNLKKIKLFTLERFTRSLNIKTYFA